MVIRGGRRVYTVPFGLYRGIKLELDLRNSFQVYVGLYERETHRFLGRRNDYEWAIDVGAGAGELSLFLLRHNPDIKSIFALDADVNETGRMRTNLQLNPELDIGKITIIDRKAGDGSNGDDVRLDDLPLDLSAPGLVKIDVEGHEMAVLKGAVGILRRRDVDLLVETHAATLELQAIELLRSCGFGVKIVDNGWYRRILPEQRPADHNRWLWASKREAA